MKKVLLLIVCMLLISCQTSAQRQGAFISDNMRAVSNKTRTCMQNIETNPSYQSIAEHKSLNGMVDPTLKQLIDDGMPTDKDIEVLIVMHNEVVHCRQQTIEDLMPVLPGLIPIIVQAYQAADLITVDLIHHKITWGESNQRHLFLRNDLKAKLLAAGEQINRDLAASHQAELAQRQAAINALSQWSYQQQTLWQNQQLINNYNRPSIIDCTTYGRTTSCISH